MCCDGEYITLSAIERGDIGLSRKAYIASRDSVFTSACKKHCVPAPPCKRRKKKCRRPKPPCPRPRKVRPATLFTEQLYKNIMTHDDWEPVPGQDTSIKSVYSYAIVNRGNNAAEVKIEISPNGTNFASDVQESVPPHSTKVVVPIRFLKYTRLSLKSEASGKPTSVDVYFQAQESIR